VQAQFQSPTGRYTAAVFHRECGATTGFNTQIALRRSWRDFSYDSGKVLAMDGRHVLSLKWVDDEHLVVLLPADQVNIQEHMWKDVTVEYKAIAR
jgi:hypothetical protein